MAKLPDKLLVDFAKAIEGAGPKAPEETFVYGTASVSGNDVTVQFDGADISTPVFSTVEVNSNDRVLVMIKNHQATVISNISASTATVNGQTVSAIRAKYADLGGFISVAGDANCWTKTSANGGHRYATSLYKHSNDGTYEYEVGMKGDASGNSGGYANLAFYIKRITLGDHWHDNGSSETDMFYVNNSGKLYAQNVDITGKVTATSGSFKGSVEATAFKATKGSFSMELNAGELKLEDSSFSSGVAVHLSGYSVASFASNTHYCEINSGDMHFKYGNGWTTISSNMVDVGNDDSNRECRLTASAAGNAGVYDPANSDWIICSNSSYDVYVPHAFRSYNNFDTTLRYPVGSSAQTNQGISWLGGTATSTLSIRGNWNSATDATKTIAVSSSDVRLKTDISDAKVSALDVINSIPVRAFTWKEDGVRQPIGVIADELEKIDPLLVVGGGEDENGEPIYKSINNLYLLGYVVKAIQELQKHDDGR